MAERAEGESKDLLTRLTGAGEDAIQRLADAPGGRIVIDAFNSLRERVDELQSRLRRVDVLEKRVDALEQKLAEQTGKPAARRRTSGARKSSSQGPASATAKQKS